MSHIERQSCHEVATFPKGQFFGLNRINCNQTCIFNFDNILHKENAVTLILHR